MTSVYKIVTYTFLFFLVSTGAYYMMVDVGSNNSNLDNRSIDEINELVGYQINNPNPFEDGNINYSLSAYSNTDQFAQSNIETKGALESIMDIFRTDGSGLKAFATPLIFVINMLPLPSGAFDWGIGMTLTYISIIVFLAFIAAWKGGLFK